MIAAEAERSQARRVDYAVKVAAGFAALLVCFWFTGKFFGITAGLAGYELSAVLSFAILLGPYWAFGFGLDRWLTTNLNPFTKTVAPLLLTLSYVDFTVPRDEFRWGLFLGLNGVVLAVSLLLASTRSPRPGWQDAASLTVLALAVELHWFDQAWPAPGLSAIPKLLFVDAGLYGYLVIRPIGGVGFDFRARFTDLRVGLREFVYYAPAALIIGLGTGFLHAHRGGSVPQFAAGWFFTFFFVALPEELFFRGLLLNLLERIAGTRRALMISSVVFGLAHFNKRAAFFNWRYVILAAIAGFFYGRAWLAQRRLVASSITHATVDTVWSIWLR